MAFVTLKTTGQKMPMIGFGLWKVTNSSCADTVYNAIKAGYRLLDGAGDYGNEKEAGEGVKRAIKDGLVKREDLFITSKLWNTYHKREHVKVIARKQLRLWGIDYFDLFLMHFPIALEYVDPDKKYPPGWEGLDGKVHVDNVPIQETWQAMEELVDEGLARNIGISNFNGGLILDLMRYARIKPAALQVELHPYLGQKDLVRLAHHLDVAVTAYSSFGPTSYKELGLDKGHPPLLEHSVILEMAKRKGKSPSQVLLNWALKQGICVIPKSNNHDRLVENLKCGDLDLTADEASIIDSLDCNKRFNDSIDNDITCAIFA